MQEALQPQKDPREWRKDRYYMPVLAASLVFHFLLRLQTQRGSYFSLYQLLVVLHLLELKL